MPRAAVVVVVVAVAVAVAVASAHYWRRLERQQQKQRGCLFLSSFFLLVGLFCQSNCRFHGLLLSPVLARSGPQVSLADI